MLNKKNNLKQFEEKIALETKIRFLKMEIKEKEFQHNQKEFINFMHFNEINEKNFKLSIINTFLILFIVLDFIIYFINNT